MKATTRYKPAVPRATKAPARPASRKATVQFDAARVLETAARLFATHGYEGVGIRRIAGESGASMAAIFYHFGSKEHLFREASLDLYESAFEEIMRAVAGEHGAERKLEQLIGGIFDRFLHDRTFFLLVQRDLTDAAAWRERPLAAQGATDFIDIASSLLDQVLDTRTERHTSFALASLLLGFCELTALHARKESPQALEGWLREQRAHLVAISKRFFFAPGT